MFLCKLWEILFLLYWPTLPFLLLSWRLASFTIGFGTLLLAGTPSISFTFISKLLVINTIAALVSFV